MIDLMQEFIMSLLYRRPHAIFFLNKGRNQARERILCTDIFRINEFSDRNRGSVIAILEKKMRSRKRIDHIGIGTHAKFVCNVRKSEIQRHLAKAFCKFHHFTDSDAADIKSIAFLATGQTTEQGFFRRILAADRIDCFVSRKIQQARSLLQRTQQPRRIDRSRMIFTDIVAKQEIVTVIFDHRAFHKRHAFMEEIALFVIAQNALALVLHFVKIVNKRQIRA